MVGPSQSGKLWFIRVGARTSLSLSSQEERGMLCYACPRKQRQRWRSRGLRAKCIYVHLTALSSGSHKWNVWQNSGAPCIVVIQQQCCEVVLILNNLLLYLNKLTEDPLEGNKWDQEDKNVTFQSVAVLWPLPWVFQLWDKTQPHGCSHASSSQHRPKVTRDLQTSLCRSHSG